MSAISAVDPRSLGQRLVATRRRGSLRALLLVLPALLFVLVTFLAPVAYLMTRAVYDPTIADGLPLTVAALKDWDATDLPDETVYAALVADLKAVQERNRAAAIAKRLNYEMGGVRSKVIASARKAAAMQAPPYKEQMIAADRLWGDPKIFSRIKLSGPAVTPFYLLRALDLERGLSGEIVPVAKEQSIYRTIVWRTLSISLMVTALTLVLAYPVAFMLAHAPERVANLLLILVLIPFWTSLLVRTTAWFVLLQDNGPLNDLLQSLHLTTAPVQMIFNRFGTVVAMTHIQLPFTLLPIYAVMKGISPSYMRAARSLGGGPFYSFLKIYLPMSMPGIGAGCLLTFILCLGYYITPALVGGPADQMVSGTIDVAMNEENNWGKAAALGAVLLTATLLLFAVYNRLVGIDKVKLG